MSATASTAYCISVLDKHDDRPELLLLPVFQSIIPAMAALEKLYPGIEVARIVERQPYWLVSHVDDVIAELLRYAISACIRYCCGDSSARAP